MTFREQMYLLGVKEAAAAVGMYNPQMPQQSRAPQMPQQSRAPQMPQPNTAPQQAPQSRLAPGQLARMSQIRQTPPAMQRVMGGGVFMMPGVAGTAEAGQVMASQGGGGLMTRLRNSWNRTASEETHNTARDVSLGHGNERRLFGVPGSWGSGKLSMPHKP